MDDSAGRKTVDILGVGVDRVDMKSAIQRMEELIAGGGTHQVVVFCVDSVMIARRDREFRSICRRASLVVPDGVPILWASRLLGNAIPGRVAGSDLLYELSMTASRKGYTSYFLGSTAIVLERLSEELCRRCPGLRIAGSYAPPFFAEFPAEADTEIVRRINESRPDILWVGMGAPKQEKWIHANLNTLNARIVIGVGAAFDICSGRVERAPVWMQKGGLEWFYRFLREPRRLFGRYFVGAAPFFPLVFMQWLKEAIGRRPR
jgi:N-acetylglucosaminyldiphosphoundecaprenol N-acetyl-beta-D-mannosaminyltransferase